MDNGVGGMNLEIGTDIYTLLHIKKNKNLLNSKETTQCSVMT